MPKKILIIGNPVTDTSSLILQKMREQYGDDIQLYTPEQAKEEGLTPADFGNIPEYKITAPQLKKHPAMSGFNKSGQQSRRERRKNQRKSKFSPTNIFRQE